MEDSHNDYIIIPNPIYDVVFKYLMQDKDSALIILSILIDEKIKRIEFYRTEAGKDISMINFDFDVVIEKEDGTEEIVMIKLQKVALETDIFSYNQFIQDNLFKNRKARTMNAGEEDFPCRLIFVFILNFKIKNETSDLMIKTKTINSGLFKGKQLKKKNKFLDILSYELNVIQLPYLEEIDKLDLKDNEYGSKLYALLKLFDQQAKQTNNKYRLKLLRQIFPEFLNTVIKRLQTAYSDNPDLEKQMKAEDHHIKQ